MYKSRLAKWDVFKTVRRGDIDALKEKVSKYREEHGSNPDFIKHNGQLVSARRIHRSLRRHRVYTQRNSLSSDNSSPGTTASGDGNLSVDGLETQTPLSDDEIATLQIAMLQTDAHFQSLRALRSLSITEDAKHVDATWLAALRCISTGSPSTEAPDLQTLPLSGAERDLAQILWEIDVYQDFLVDQRIEIKPTAFTCSSVEKVSARDFYARTWIFPRDLCGSGKFKEIAFTLWDQLREDIDAILEEHHPHFLPWLCFVMLRAESHCVSSLETFVLYCSSLCNTNDPRSRIRQILSGSKFRRDIGLVMLRRILDDFRGRCTAQDQQDLKMLAELFEHVVDSERMLTTADVEPVLQEWARASLSIAEIIDERNLKDLLEKPKQILAGTVEVT
jgi:hypothetical protein